VKNVYESCPVYESENFMLRLVSLEDAEDLLPCYSQPTDSVITNSFNCDFGYGCQTLDGMRDFISCWFECYKNGAFVRWSVVDKKTCKAIGTIELFNRKSSDFFNNCGMLRLDLHNDYENATAIEEILALILAESFSLFDYNMVTTKVSTSAVGRMSVLKALRFRPTDEKIMGRDGTCYDGFWICEKEMNV